MKQTTNSPNHNHNHNHNNINNTPSMKEPTMIAVFGTFTLRNWEAGMLGNCKTRWYFIGQQPILSPFCFCPTFAYRKLFAAMHSNDCQFLCLASLSAGGDQRVVRNDM